MSINFTFGEPEYGWMDVKILGESSFVEESVSDVPCDSILSLVQSLVALKAGSKYEKVEFSLEPRYLILEFKLIGSANLSLEVFTDNSSSDVVRFEGDKNQVLDELFKALVKLESFPCWCSEKANEVVWSWEFPKRELLAYKK